MLVECISEVKILSRVKRTVKKTVENNVNVGAVRIHIEKWGIGCINAVLQCEPAVELHF